MATSDYINKITCGDCLELMKGLEDKSVDMILCDLPYGTTRNKWDTVLLFDSLWERYGRIIKDNGAIVLTAAQPFTTDLINSNRKLFKYDLIWYKPLGSGFLNAKKMPMRNHEHILIFYKSLPVYNPIMRKGKLRDKGHPLSSNTVRCYGKYKAYTSCNDQYYPQSVIDVSNGDNTKENEHPTQKPAELFEYLIRTYTNEGDLVLDNCIGSGTTAVACINTNRRFIGFEISAEYCNIANRRIEQAQAQGRLF